MMAGISPKAFFSLLVIATTIVQGYGSFARTNDRDRAQIIDNGGLFANGSLSNGNDISSSTRQLENRFDNFERDREDDRRPHKRPSGPQTIPGTNLKTRTFYKLSMKRYPHGYITWTPQKNFVNGYRYVQIDNNREHAQKYERNGDLFKDIQWEFVPVSGDQRYRWYKLRNRGRPKEYATWSVTEFLSENVESNYLILDSNYPGRRSRRDFLFRPVSVQGRREDDRDDKQYYQLKLKENRKGVITWSDKEYARECYYMQIDSDERRRRRYEKGNDRFDDTLFTIELAEKEDIDDEEEIEDNNDDKIDDDD